MSLHKAIEAAKKADNPVRNFRLAAFIFNKSGKLIAKGYGQKKTHPKQAAFAASAGNPDKVCLHAEIDAIIKGLKWSNKNNKTLKGATIFVARVTKADTPALAKPCDVCSAVIKKFGIKVIHT